ncbi:unnamed protein product [Amoebophrya sp. A120]|nr:unnamed protein product [Amoebophrya sp. A120]|eukprot:GSA120T00021280001.1
MLSSLRKDIRETISVGAPMYNNGNPSGCLRLYRGLAGEMLSKMGRASSLDQTEKQAQDRLQKAMEKIDQRSATMTMPTSSSGSTSNSMVKEDAWTLRRAFDDILSMGTPDMMPDMEDVRVVKVPCQNPRNCQFPNCNCESKATRSSSSTVMMVRNQNCQNPKNCKFPNCNCGAAPSNSDIARVCQNPRCCKYPNCNCGSNSRSCGGGVPSVCQNPRCCKYPNCNCGRAAGRSSSCGRGGMRGPPMGCRNPHCCQFPRCGCNAVSRGC